MSDIRKLSDNEIERYLFLQDRAYSRFRIMSGDIGELKERALKAQVEDPRPTKYGFYRDGEMIGTMRLYDYLMNFGSKMIYVGGIGSVAVDLLHKKEKVCKEMISFALKKFRQNGQSFAVLYPFRTDFYRKMGFGFGTKMNRYKLRPSQLPKGESKKNIRLLTKDDIPGMLSFYRRYMKRFNGMFDRMEIDFKRIFDHKDNRVIGYLSEGEVRGYAVFQFAGEYEANFISNNMNVTEFVYENSEALSQFMTFFNSQSDQIEWIVFNTQDEYFHHIFSNPADDSKNLLPSVYHQSNTSGVGIMYRAVNSKDVFEVLKYHNFGNQTCRVSFDIEDDFIPENNVKFTVEFIEGQPTVIEDDECDFGISMKVSDFSSMLMGSVTFERLYNYGFARISDDVFFNSADDLFKTRHKPICMTAF